ncbi:MAG: M48 family metalloprotease [Pseudomonadota bacterium]
MLNRLIATIILAMLLASPVAAKKYKPINEIPGQVPETDEEKGIWQVGLAHQEKVRGTDELVNNAALEEYLEGIVNRLLGDMKEQIGVEADVLVFKEPTVNAWVYPNGTVGIQTGMLAAMENEAQLASILGHEVSHFLNRHAFIQIKSKQKQSVIGKGLGVLATAAVAAKTGTVNTGLLNSGQVWTELVTSGYSRKLETAADKQGLELVIAAGYPADQAIPAFETMRMDEDDEINVAKMWSSHPDIDARKKNLAKQIKRSKAPASDQGMDKTSYLKAVRLAVLSNSQLLVQAHQYEDAIASLSDFTSTLNQDAEAEFLLGEVYRKQTPQGNFETRIGAYQKSVTIKPELAEPYRELGMAYRQQGKREEAAQAYRRYLELKPDAPDAPIMQWYLDNLATAEPATGN